MRRKADVQFILPDAEPPPELEIIDEYLESPYTSILMSAATGDGLYTAMAKTKASFEITAHDQNGERRPVGGDPFAVSVRGAAYVYAKVNDNGDGSYRVDYKPSTSGGYTIAITLHGVPMPGSPFALTVLVPRADASRCVLRGDALKTIVARTPSSFDLEFCDAFGQIAHAEELDVYVEPRPRLQADDENNSPPPLVSEIAWAVVAPATKPLLVRASVELDSEMVGEVGPGQMVGVVETAEIADGARRARIIFRPGATRIGGGGGLGSPERSRTSSPASTRTNTPCNTARGSHTPSSRPSTPGRAGHSPRRSPGRSPAASPRSAGRNAPLLSNPLDGSSTPGRSARSPRLDKARLPSFARPLGEPASADSRRSRAPPACMNLLAPGALTARDAGEAGWITAARDGKEMLVTRHMKLDASRRQAQMQLWAKQLASEANRKASESRVRGTAEEVRAARAGPSCAHELEADRSGVGFAYGGVDPGTLHAHGKLVKTHTVHFSVGCAGEYLLHVGIRNQTAALPGSPFELAVVPSAAHPVATSLPTDASGCALPLRGVVGEPGSVIFTTCDRMGNRCREGNAPLRVETRSRELQTSHIDNQDGTYALQWLGEVSGKYELNVTIDNVNVTGSPIELTLLSAVPDVPKCEVSGGGLSNAVAGEKVFVTVRCKDRFSNPTTPGTAMSFGLAVAPPPEGSKHAEKEHKKGDKGKSGDEGEKKERKEKDKEEEGASTLPSKDFEGIWKAEGEYEIRYFAEKAGDYELHLWCDTEGNGVRQKLPGSPFSLNVVAAKASATGSLITGADAMRLLTAGDRLELSIHFRDDFGNACAPPSRAPRANPRSQPSSSGPSSADEELQAPSRAATRRASSSVGGLEPGSHADGGIRNRRGSIAAGSAKWRPGEPGGGGAQRASAEREEGVTARLVTPGEEEAITDKLRPGDAVGTFALAYELQVAGIYEAHFMLGGSPLSGSPVTFQVKPAQPSGRLSTLHPPVDTPPVIGVPYELLLIAEDKYTNRLDRGGANVQARALGPSASPAATIDHNDGTYGVRFTAGAVGEYRVEVRLDNVKIKGSPHLINFVEPTAAQRRALAANASAPAGSPSGGAGGRSSLATLEGGDAADAPPSFL